ncbi:MAG: ATP-dependent zinc protease [bacterium]|nr:ATP-dependent zinc protease [bacterium]
MFRKLLLRVLGIRVLANYEDIKVEGLGTSMVIRAKVDTGARMSSIDQAAAEQLGLLKDGNLIETRMFKSGLGHQRRQIVKATLYLQDKKINTEVSVIDRSHMAYKMLIGVADMNGFLVKPSPLKGDILRHTKNETNSLPSANS